MGKDYRNMEPEKRTDFNARFKDKVKKKQQMMRDHYKENICPSGEHCTYKGTGGSISNESKSKQSVSK